MEMNLLPEIERFVIPFFQVNALGMFFCPVSDQVAFYARPFQIDVRKCPAPITGSQWNR